jgi:hypothetical protein
MSAASRENVNTGSGYLAAARHFEKLAKLCASRTAKNPRRLTSRQMESSLKAFRKAPPAELAEVRALLNFIISEIEKSEPRAESDEGANGTGGK